jgi:hypothetical protein
MLRVENKKVPLSTRVVKRAAFSFEPIVRHFSSGHGPILNNGPSGTDTPSLDRFHKSCPFPPFRYDSLVAMTSTHKKRILLSVGAFSAALMLAGFIIHREPFAARYKGKTVNQWLSFYVEEAENSGGSKCPTDDVISEFGTNALPVLTENNKLPYWFKLKAIDKAFNRPIIEKLFRMQMQRASDRVTVASLWGYHLLLSDDQRNSPLIPTLLEINPDDNLVLMAVRFQEAGDGSHDTLLYIVRYVSNEKIRTRAAKLVKPYKKWDNKTFQKWLSEVGDPHKKS